mgnify:FL=1
MSGWQILSNDRSDPMKRKMRWDSMENKMTVVSAQDNLEDCLAMNKAFLNAERKTNTLWNGASYVKVASIPLQLLERWYHEEGINFWRQSEEDRARISKKLNDGDYNRLRTAPGKI